eukprot:scaffold535_cov260-Pinguiococcus_pyrenoidosus.AAC.22
MVVRLRSAFACTDACRAVLHPILDVRWSISSGDGTPEKSTPEVTCSPAWLKTVVSVAGPFDAQVAGALRDHCRYWPKTPILTPRTVHRQTLKSTPPVRIITPHSSAARTGQR